MAEEFGCSKGAIISQMFKDGISLRDLEENTTEGPMPYRHGELWSAREQGNLIRYYKKMRNDSYEHDYIVAKLCRRHQRSEGGIIARLIKVGLIENPHRRY